MHGVKERQDENEAQRKHKVRAMLAHTVNKRSAEDRMEIAENIPIAWTECLG